MPSPASTSTDTEPPRQPQKRRRRLPALLAVAVVSVLLLPPTSGQAAPMPREDADEKLDRLEKKADKLTEEYRGKLHGLDDATRAARQAKKRVQELEREWDAARERVAELAAARYKSGWIDPVIVLATSESPQGLIDRAAMAQYLARSGDNRLRELQRLREEARKARQETRAQVEEARRLVDQLEDRKDEVAELIAKYEAQEAARKKREAKQAAADRGGGGGSGGGGSSASTPNPQSPLTACGSQITARLRQVVAEVDQRFGPFPTIGCYRAGSSGEHPLGRAGDFMLSTGGTMPSAEMIDRGWQIAKWARANASRLGVMYVIYRQQIWDVRSGGGWRQMEDRGSVTANHYDHVHISVF